MAEENAETMQQACGKSTSRWPKKVQDAVSQQVNLELHASYVYLMMGQFFDRHDVALKNIAKYFKECSEEEKQHANDFIEHNHKRGGTTTYTPIDPSCFSPNDPEEFTALDAMQHALKLEEEVYESLLALHDTAENDPEFTDIIASKYLHEQVDAIDQLKGYITNLKRVGRVGLGEYMFDKFFRQNE